MNHVHVATAEYLINFRTHQICLSFTDSDNVILRQERETTHVSILKTSFSTRNLLDLVYFFELLTSGVEHSADGLADARDFAFDVLEVLPLLH